MPYIEGLCLDSYLSYFNLDNFFNLRVLSLGCNLEENFNLKFFKNLCNQLESIQINIEEKTFFKLFDGYNFPSLVDLTIENFFMKRLTKNLSINYQSLDD